MELRLEAGDVGHGEVGVQNRGVLVDSTVAVGVRLIREYVLAFEIIGLLLVASLIGGLLLMRNPGPGSEGAAEAAADAPAGNPPVGAPRVPPPDERAVPPGRR